MGRDQAVDNTCLGSIGNVDYEPITKVTDDSCNSKHEVLIGWHLT